MPMCVLTLMFSNETKCKRNIIFICDVFGWIPCNFLPVAKAHLTYRIWTSRLTWANDRDCWWYIVLTVIYPKSYHICNRLHQFHAQYFPSRKDQLRRYTVAIKPLRKCRIKWLHFWLTKVDTFSQRFVAICTREASATVDDAHPDAP